MKFPRNLEVGDSIECRVGRATLRYKIAEILSQDCYNCDWDESRSYVDIEFKDQHGGYHHYKSHLDGGRVLYRKDTFLAKYHDKHTGRFYVPFTEVDSNISSEMLALMKVGYALSAYDNGDENVYTLFNLEHDCTRFSKVADKEIKETLYDLLHNNGCHFCTEMPVDKYFSNELYQNAFDKVLLNGTVRVRGVELWTVVLMCSSDGKNFEFIQAEDCFA